MCGIVAYTGPGEGIPLVIEGLSRLEYRGYDSAGLAFFHDGRIVIERAAGKLDKLKAKVCGEPPSSNAVIGHTRWATHGRPTEINAHPHVSGKTALVHNGIIENYLELRDYLTAKGAGDFYSDTDSEVIAHLINYFYKGSLPEALAEALAMIEGSYALAILHEDHPDEIYLARRSSPLVAAVSAEGGFAASDIPAVLKHTRDFVFLEDDDIAVLTRGAVTVMDRSLKKVERKLHHIDWSAGAAEKGGYRHFMLKEINEQDRAVMDTLRGRLNRAQADIMLFDGDTQFFKGRKKIFIVACGTSWHAALVGKYYIEGLARVPVEVDLASEFRYRDPIITPDDLVIVISQSGETADTLAALRAAKEPKVPVLAVCNVVGSTIAREADTTLFTYAGPEIGVASTKAFTTQLVTLYLIALKVGIAKGHLPKSAVHVHIRGLSELPEIIESVLKDSGRIEKIAHDFYRSNDFLFLGRGMNYPIALEGALKLKEISYIHAEGYPAGELKHGPLALVDRNMPVVAVMPSNAMAGKMFSNLKEVAARDGRIVALTTEGSNDVEEIAEAVIPMPPMSEWQEPIVYIVPLQLLSYHVAVNKGTDVDQPRNLAKSVTVE